MAKYKRVVQNDKGQKLKFILKKQDGTAWDLTGATVSLYMINRASNVEIVRTCTVPSGTATQGICEYILTADDTAIPGAYILNCRIVKAGFEGGTITAGELEIINRPDTPAVP